MKKIIISSLVLLIFYSLGLWIGYKEGKNDGCKEGFTYGWKFREILGGLNGRLRLSEPTARSIYTSFRNVGIYRKCKNSKTNASK